MNEEIERLSWIDIKLSYIGEYARLSRFPITEVAGLVFQCENGCKTPYNTPMRWYIATTMLTERFVICPTCKKPHVKMLGLYHRISQEKHHWIWDVE